MAVSMIHYYTGERVRLVFACAWCPKSKQPDIKQDEEYSHGICETHYRELMEELKKKRGRTYKTLLLRSQSPTVAKLR